MKVRALQNFAGLVTMTIGEEKDIEEIYAEDLIRAGHAELIPESKPPIPPKTNVPKTGQKTAKTTTTTKRVKK